MNKIVLSIGSNSNDKNLQINKALKWLSLLLQNYRCSSIYSTPPISGNGDNYLNCVVSGEIETDMISINNLLKEYEKNCGRTKESKINVSIPIDIDIVIFNEDIIKRKDYEYDYFKKGYHEII